MSGTQQVLTIAYLINELTSLVLTIPNDGGGGGGALLLYPFYRQGNQGQRG